MPDQNLFQRLKHWSIKPWPREKQLFLPLPLIALNALGSVFIVLGLVKQFYGLELLPSLFRFEHDALIFLGVGFALTIPALIHVIMRNIARGTEEPLRPGIADTVQDTADSVQPVDFRGTPAGIHGWIKQLWDQKWFVDLTWVAVVLYLLYPVVPTYPPFDELKVVSGTLSFRVAGARTNRHYPLLLDGEMYACDAGPFGSRLDCFAKEHRSVLTGQRARVFWYEQESRLFDKSYRVAMQVEVGGRVMFDYQKQIQRFTDEYQLAQWIAIVVVSVVFLLIRVTRHLLAKSRKLKETAS